MEYHAAIKNYEKIFNSREKYSENLSEDRLENKRKHCKTV